MNIGTNGINWFEIPMLNLSRAQKFYQDIFLIEMDLIEVMGMQMLMFPPKSPQIGGALVKSKNHKPSLEGSILYLNANPDLQLVLDRIDESNAEIVLEKTLIDENNGFMAFFIDTEGNLIGLHSSK